MSSITKAPLRYEDLRHLSEDVLYNLARNDSAPVENRKMCVQVLIDKASSKVDLPELAVLKSAVLVVETLNHESEITAIEPVLPPITPENTQLEPIVEDFGPLKASVTTQTLSEPPAYSDTAFQKMDTSDFTPAYEAPISDPQHKQ